MKAILLLPLFAVLIAPAGATDFDGLKAMAADPAVAARGFTGSAYGAQEPILVAANAQAKPAPTTSEVGVGIFGLNASVGVGRDKRYQGGPAAQQEGSFKKAVKNVAGWVGSFAMFGAFIGFLVGLFGGPTLVAGTVAGALIGATIGLVFGVANALVEWGS